MITYIKHAMAVERGMVHQQSHADAPTHARKHTHNVCDINNNYSDGNSRKNTARRATPLEGQPPTHFTNLTANPLPDSLIHSPSQPPAEPSLAVFSALTARLRTAPSATSATAVLLLATGNLIIATTAAEINNNQTTNNRVEHNEVEHTNKWNEFHNQQRCH